MFPSPKRPPRPAGGFGPRSNTLFLGLTRRHSSNVVSIRSSVFAARLTDVRCTFTGPVIHSESRGFCYTRKTPFPRLIHGCQAMGIPWKIRVHGTAALGSAAQEASSTRNFATVHQQAEWLACWTQAQKGPGSNRCRVTVSGKLFTPIVPLFTKQQNW